MNKNRISILFLFCSLWAFDFSQAQSVIEVLQNNTQTTAFVNALEESNIDDKLADSGPFTIFAPTNQVFNNLPAWQKTDPNILLNHIFTGLATVRSLRVMTNVTCLSGKTITITEINGNLSVASHDILQNNIRASNGVIHIIDGVIR